MTSIEKNIIRKWEPVIEQLGYPTRNKVLFEHICNYCEWQSSLEVNNDEFIDKLSKIRERVDNSKRVGIVRNVFNVFTGVEEYELDNGKYVPVNSSFSYELSCDELIEVLGLEYMKFYDPIEFRDKQIDKIIL
jgi:hypothetical protein